MQRKFRITVDGHSYNVIVEEIVGAGRDGALARLGRARCPRRWRRRSPRRHPLRARLTPAPATWSPRSPAACSID